MPSQPSPVDAGGPPPQASFTRRQVLETIRRYWGFDALRPLQEEAIRAALRRRDSLVVMPTGGGKSLCYQAPPLLIGGLTVVVSPLIALMKDQVDGLRLSGYPGAALHSGMSSAEQRDVEALLEAGELTLLLVAPERLLSPGFLSRLARLEDRAGTGIVAFAIDEAHCISQWGHDFRPEYRRLAEVRECFPAASVHAFTATATRRVRDDIVHQLRLRSPEVLVGRFDRPNLTYRILPRLALVEQTADAIRRHSSGEGAGATIVYCITRRETEELAEALTRRGLAAEAYHAGMKPDDRRRVQDDFAQERLNIVVATVAFGMGIDRSNVRCVVHAAMPKSVEHYQQETGRAGRDGLPAECVLLYTQADAMRWEKIMALGMQEAMQRGEEEAGDAAENQRIQRALLERMQRFCTSARCRHRALSEYFGQDYQIPAGLDPENGCGACDVCLGDMEIVEDSTTIAQKILSCIARTGQNLGGAYIADVLRGAGLERIRQRKHDQLSTYGILAGTPRTTLLSYIGQLIDAGILNRTSGEYPVLTLTAESIAVMKGQRTVTLLEPRRTLTAEVRTAEQTPLSEPEAELFEHLRHLRMDVAQKRGVPPYIVFTDATLRELVRHRPTTRQSLARIRGIGQQRLAEFGDAFAAAIAEHSSRLGLETNLTPAAAPARAERPPRGTASGSRASYFDLYEKGASIEEAARTMGHRPGTAAGYLVQFIQERSPASIAPWVDDATRKLILDTAVRLRAETLKPIYEALEGRIDYTSIRLALIHARPDQPQADKTAPDPA